MFFLIYPTGLDYQLRQRGFFSFIVIGLVLYRAVLSIVFPRSSVMALPYFPPEELTPQFFSALFQSLFTAPVPRYLILEHQIVIWASVFFLVLFWWIFGPALEDRLSRPALIGAYFFGAAIGILMMAADIFGMTGVFWLGMSATIFVSGMCYPLFSDNDVRVVFFLFFIWSGGGYSQFRMPTVFALVPMSLFFFCSQSLFWYNEKDSVIAVRFGEIQPIGWALLLTFLGAAAGIMWKKYERDAALRAASLPEEDAPPSSQHVAR